MKTPFTFFIALLITATSFAQQGINYKAQIKDGDGAIVANDEIQVRFTISAIIIPIYQETHSPTTDDNGIIIINIGEGTTISGDFGTIDWASAPHTLQVEIDTGGGFVNLGATPFKHVPYALSSRSAQTNAIVTSPGYLDTTYTGLEPGGQIKVVFEFNIQMDPSTFVVGSSFTATGSGGSATGTLQWTNGNTRLVFTSNEPFTTIAPCFSGGMLFTIKGSGINKVLDVQGKPIDGNRDGVAGGNFVMTFDIVC